MGVILFGNVVTLLDYFSSSFWKKKINRKGLMLIWRTTI